MFPWFQHWCDLWLSAGQLASSRILLRPYTRRSDKESRRLNSFTLNDISLGQELRHLNEMIASVSASLVAYRRLPPVKRHHFSPLRVTDLGLDFGKSKGRGGTSACGSKSSPAILNIELIKIQTHLDNVLGGKIDLTHTWFGVFKTKKKCRN